MRHVDHLTRFSDSSPADFSAQIRAARGQFFTHELVGRRLASRLAATATNQTTDVRVIDPFAGDGRLLAWLVEEWPHRSQHLTIEVWESDENYINTAANTVQDALARQRQRGSVVARKVDSFREGPGHFNTFDIVITNPPWEALKPDRRHLNALDRRDRETYVDELRQVDQALADIYPEAQPARKFAGWGTNLSRVGAALSHRLLRSGGQAAMVLPASFTADSTHGALRSALLRSSRLDEVASYPAEARLFDGVDVPFVTVLLQRTLRERDRIRVLQFDKTGSRPVELSVEHPAPNDDEWRLPLHPAMLGGEALGRVSKFPTFDEVLNRDGFWAGRELDETGLAQHLTSGGIRFMKGKNIRRFGLDPEPEMWVARELADRFPSAKKPRLAWRDVSRPSQLRRVQASLLPANVLTGNSLGVLTVPNDRMQTLNWFLGVFSSAVFEAQLRTVLSTGHVTLASLRKVHLPPLDGPNADLIARLARSQSSRPTHSNQTRLEYAVAQDFELTDHDVTDLFSRYPWLPKHQAQQTLPFEGLPA